jgi:hypothetical protein
LFKGYLFAEALRHIEPEPFISYAEHVFDLDGAEKILSACGITRNMDRNLFWTRLNTLVGDFGFSGQSYLSS